MGTWSKLLHGSYMPWCCMLDRCHACSQLTTNLDSSNPHKACSWSSVQSCNVRDLGLNCVSFCTSWFTLLLVNFNFSCSASTINRSSRQAIRHCLRLCESRCWTTCRRRTSEKDTDSLSIIINRYLPCSCTAAVCDRNRLVVGNTAVRDYNSLRLYCAWDAIHEPKR